MDERRNPGKLTPEVLQDIAARGVVKRFPARTVLIHEGSAGDALFIVLEGRCKAYSTHEDGKEVVFTTIRAGEYFGELAFDGGLRDASVMTLEPTTCAVVNGEALRAFIAAHPDFGTHLVHSLIARVRALSERVRELVFKDVYQRLVQLLYDESEPEGETRVLRERLTHRDIAERVGSSREMVSRILKDLTTGGYITLRDGRLVILKKLPPRW